MSMANNEQKIVIDGTTFVVAPFPPREGLRLKAHLVRTFGPAIAEIIGGIDGSKIKSIGDMDIGNDSLVKGLNKLFEQLDEDSFDALIERLMRNVIANWKEGGKPRSIAFGTDYETAMGLVFTGKLFSIYPLLLFVLKVNYPDFLSKVVKGGIGQKMKATFTSAMEDATPPSESEKSETSES